MRLHEVQLIQIELHKDENNLSCSIFTGRVFTLASLSHFFALGGEFIWWRHLAFSLSYSQMAEYLATHYE